MLESVDREMVEGTGDSLCGINFNFNMEGKEMITDRSIHRERMVIKLCTYSSMDKKNFFLSI